MSAYDFIAKFPEQGVKLLNFFFSYWLKPFSCHDSVKIICLTWLANKFAAVSKVYDLIMFESKVQVVVSQGCYEILFALGRHEVLSRRFHRQIYF